VDNGYESKLEALENVCYISLRNIQTAFKEKITASLTPNSQKLSKSLRPGAPRSAPKLLIILSVHLEIQDSEAYIEDQYELNFPNEF